jgi:transaldolase
MNNKNYLQWLNYETQTRWWHDSAIPDEIDAGLKLGALGVTTNPVLTYKSLNAIPDFWKPQVESLSNDLTPPQRAEALLKIVATHAAKKVYDIYIKTEGRHGYAFGQLNPGLAGDKTAMLEQGLRVASWADNVAVKVPCTKAAMYVIEELSARGVALCTSLNFSVSQAIAVGEAYKRGIGRARKSGITVKPCYVVQQGGRLEDYLQDVALDLELNIPGDIINKAGNLLTKRSYQIFSKRGYEASIMPAGLRRVEHLTELAGGKFVFTLHPRIQKMVMDADPPKAEKIDTPINGDDVEMLMRIPDFRRAYCEYDLPENEFITFGVMQKTLSQFMETGWALLETYGTGSQSTRWT